MKILLTICMLIAATCASANEMPAATQAKAAPVSGEVLEVINVQNFTYMRLKTAREEIWTAVISATVKKGSVVTIEDAIVMNNFESKTLKRTFPMILFGKLSGAQSTATAPSVMGSSLLAHKQKLNQTDKPTQPVAKASGANAHTVAEIVQQRLTLNGKTVVVRGKVVKYNPEVMGKNWVHVQDGSG
ncbi:MAG: nucleotide-binding protein, partial [Gallionella sp.]